MFKTKETATEYPTGQSASSICYCKNMQGDIAEYLTNRQRFIEMMTSASVAEIGELTDAINNGEQTVELHDGPIEINMQALSDALRGNVTVEGQAMLFQDWLRQSYCAADRRQSLKNLFAAARSNNRQYSTTLYSTTFARALSIADTVDNK